MALEQQAVAPASSNGRADTNNSARQINNASMHSGNGATQKK